MKKTLFAAASLMMFAACSNTEDVLQNDKVANEGRLVTVTTTLPGDTPDSRVVLTEENADTDSRKIAVKWKESGETFSVMTATSTAAQTFTQTEGSNEFTGELTNDWAQPYYAFYPATLATNATAVPYDLSTQTGALSEATNYMYAVNTTDGKEYHFQHLTAIVKFTLNLPNGYTPDSLSLVSDRLLAKGTVNLTGDAVVYTNELSAHSITVVNPTVSNGKIVLYLNVSPMAASEASKNILHIRTHSGSKGYSGSISTSKEIKAGKYYTATVDVTTHDYDFNDATGYTVYTPWGLRAWGEGKANTTQYKTVVYGCKLMNDMDMSTLPNDIEIEGHAGNWKTTKPMKQSTTFDGANKTISNLRIIGGYKPGPKTWNYVGFIGYCNANNSNVIKDATFKGTTVVNNLSDNSRIGIVVGCPMSTNISGITIVPNPNSTEPVFRIFNDEKTVRIGSIVGYAWKTNLKNCINNQDLTIGGINGSTPACNFLSIGGIAGETGTSSSFLQCVNNGDIDVDNVTLNRSDNYAGGIVPQMLKTQFIACANTGSITAATKFKIYGIGYDATTTANYGCYTVNHAATTINTSNPATLTGFYDSVSTDVTGVTKVEDFNIDDVVNGMNNALVTYNNTADLADAKKCDKHWAISTDTNYPYPVLVEGAPTASTTP